jgi:hypothetical protein
MSNHHDWFCGSAYSLIRNLRRSNFCDRCLTSNLVPKSIPMARLSPVYLNRLFRGVLWGGIAISALAILSLLVLVIWDRSWRSHPGEIEHRLQTTGLGPDAPQLPDGRPDYRRVLNVRAASGISPATNAAVEYYRILGTDAGSSLVEAQLCQELEIPLMPAGRKILGDLPIDPPEAFDDLNRPWKSSEFPVIATFLDEHAELITEAEQATHLPHCYMPLICVAERYELINNLTPLQQQTRRLARIFRAAAFHALGDGDITSALRWSRTNLRLADHSANSSLISELLCSFAHELSALETTEQAALLSQPSDLPELRAALGDIQQSRDRRDDLLRALDAGERYMMLDHLWATSQYGADSDAPLVRQPLYQRKFDWPSILHSANRWSDRTVDVMRLASYSKRAIAARQWERDLEVLATTRSSILLAAISRTIRSRALERIMIPLLSPAVAALTDIEARLRAHRHLAMVSLAAAIFRHEQGVYPATLDSLITMVGAEAVMDPFSEQPLVYRRFDGPTPYRLYSVGADGEDHQGRVAGNGEPHDLNAAYMHAGEIVPASEAKACEPPSP